MTLHHYYSLVVKLNKYFCYWCHFGIVPTIKYTGRLARTNNVVALGAISISSILTWKEHNNQHTVAYVCKNVCKWIKAFKKNRSREWRYVFVFELCTQMCEGFNDHHECFTTHVHVSHESWISKCNINTDQYHICMNLQLE